MTKYIVSGYIGFDNFGDEAVAHVLSEMLKQKGAESVTFISSNPDKTKKMHNVDSCKMLNFIFPLIKSDVLISGGGSLLQDVTSLKSLIYYLGVIYIALLFGKKVEIFAQGIGPINSKIGLLLAKFALKRASSITVRDVVSQKLLESWGIKSDVVDDPVFQIEIPNYEKENSVGIQLRSFKGVNTAFLNNLAKEVTTRFQNREIKIISLQDSADLDVCSEFNNLLLQRGMNSKVIHSLSPANVLEQISKLETLIAMRFHAGVIGIKSGVKTLMINYDPKVKNLAEKYNLPIIEIEDSDFSEQFNKLTY